MPVTYGTYQKQLKLLPLTLHAEGGATLSVRFGYVDSAGNYTPSTEQQFTFSSEDVSTILDQNPVPGLSRRDDLSLALYQYLVTNNKIPAGDIS
jgi:hypothetical protein